MIVVYWLKADGEPACAKFEDKNYEHAVRIHDLHVWQGMQYVVMEHFWPQSIAETTFPDPSPEAARQLREWLDDYEAGKRKGIYR